MVICQYLKEPALLQPVPFWVSAVGKGQTGLVPDAECAEQYLAQGNIIGQFLWHQFIVILMVVRVQAEFDVPGIHILYIFYPQIGFCGAMRLTLYKRCYQKDI